VVTELTSHVSRYVLVTGATGFIGAHVVDVLLRRGLRVRGATRNAAKGREMLDARPQFSSKLEFVTIDGFEQTGVFDHALEGIDGVIHVASVCVQSARLLPTRRISSLGRISRFLALYIRYHG